MKCSICGYDDNGTGDSAHSCGTSFFMKSSAPMGANGEAIPLPPLPDKTALSITMPDGMGMAMVMWGTKKCSGQKQALYTAEQMQDYARQAIAPYAERIRQLERELATIKESKTVGELAERKTARRFSESTRGPQRALTM